MINDDVADLLDGLHEEEKVARTPKPLNSKESSVV
jgi:hypothetical protein